MFDTKKKLFPLFLIRWAGLPLDAMPYEPCTRFRLTMQKERLQTWLEQNQQRLTNALFRTIKEEETDCSTSDLLSLKRNVFNHRAPNPELLYRVVAIGPHRLARLLRVWHAVLLQIQDLNNQGSQAPTDEELKQFLLLLDIARRYPDFQKALAFSNPSMYRSLHKYLQQPPHQIRTRERKFQVSLVKFLSRTLYKTSPFSYLGVVGIGKWQEDATSVRRSSSNIQAHSRLNETIRLELLESWADRYQLQPNIWVQDSELMFFKRQSGPKPSITFQIKESITRIEQNEWTDFLMHTPFPEGGYHVDELIELAAAHFQVERVELKSWVEQTIEAQLLIKCYPHVVHELSELEDFSLQLSSHSADARIQWNEEMQRRLAGLNIPSNAFPAYEDVIDHTYTNFNRAEWAPVLQDLELLHDILPLFDKSLGKRLLYAEHFRTNFKGYSQNLPELVEDYYSFWGKQENDRLQVEEVNILNSLLESLFVFIGHQLHASSIELDRSHLQQLATQIPSSVRHPLSSAMFFVQPSRSNGLVLNKVYSGFGRCFSRFASWNEQLAFDLSVELRAIQQDHRSFTDLFCTYGSNTNLHPQITEHSFEDQKLTDLHFAYDQVSKQVFVHSSTGKEILPLHLGQMSIGNLGVSHRFLASLTQFDMIDLNLSEFLFKQLLQEDSERLVYRIPEVRLGRLTLLRRQWWIRNQALVEQLESLSDWDGYGFLLSLFKQEGIPLQFYMSPSRFTQLQDFSKIDDFYKPQYIDLRSEHFVRIFKKNVQEYGVYLLLEEVNPAFHDIPSIKGPTRQVEFGIELYREP